MDMEDVMTNGNQNRGTQTHAHATLALPAALDIAGGELPAQMGTHPPNPVRGDEDS
jgi:hypothetical protein